MKVGKYLQQQRLDKDVTQAEIAEKLNFKSSQFVSNVERGLCNPPPEKIEKWCEIISADPKHCIDLIIEAKRLDMYSKIGA